MKALSDDMKTIRDLANSPNPDAWKEIRFYVAFIEEGISLLLRSYFTAEEKYYFDFEFKKMVTDSLDPIIPKLPMELVGEVGQLMARIGRTNVKRLGNANKLEPQYSRPFAQAAATVIAISTTLGALWHAPVQDNLGDDDNANSSNKF